MHTADALYSTSVNFLYFLSGNPCGLMNLFLSLFQRHLRWELQNFQKCPNLENIFMGSNLLPLKSQLSVISDLKFQGTKVLVFLQEYRLPEF